MAQVDITPRGPLRLGIASAQRLWMNSPGSPVRVRAVDLRDLSQQVRAIRAESPDVDVVVDIEIMIARDAPTAREAMTRIGNHDGSTLLYVGTPTGLAGLVADIHALGIADGAVLIPLVDDGVIGLIHDVVIPQLQTMAAA